MTSYWSSLLLLLSAYAIVNVVTAECGSSYFVCLSSGECVKWRYYCDGICHCSWDCSDEDQDRCQVPGGENANSLQDSSGSSSDGIMSSAAMVGIVVACLAMLFLLVAALIFFIVCRRRLLAAKPRDSQSRRAVADARALQESGCGLPVDIPVQALTREPPPRYTSVDDLSAASTTTSRLSVSVLPPPPPYSAQLSTRRDDSLADDSLTASPFNMDTSTRSMSGIILHTSSPRVAPRAGSASAGRLRSVDSFTEYPSMSEILLTSSKSSLPTSAEAATIELMPGSPRSRRSDSARGDSIESWPSAEHGAPGSSGSSEPPQRSCSLTDVAVAHGGSGRTVPDSELQRQARRHRPSMDPGPAAEEAGTGHQRRRRTETGSAAAIHQRRKHGDQRSGRRSHKSRSLSHMTTVDEEQMTTMTRLETPAFTGSAV